MPFLEEWDPAVFVLLVNRDPLYGERIEPRSNNANDKEAERTASTFEQPRPLRATLPKDVDPQSPLQRDRSPATAATLHLPCNLVNSENRQEMSHADLHQESGAAAGR